MSNIGTAGGDADTLTATLANGARVVVIPLPHLATAAVSVFVRSGSQHESARLNGIGHVIEHMAFKGTRSRDCQQINLDAERLGAEVNAHTDKDHTAFHMRGLARDAAAFVRMLGDIVRESTFPEGPSSSASATSSSTSTPTTRTTRWRRRSSSSTGPASVRIRQPAR